MSAKNFDFCLAEILEFEGGYVNHPADPGGATNMGITHKTLAAWRKVPSVTPNQVKMLTLKEASAIYRAQYWKAVKGDDLPSGLDLAVFDFAVTPVSAVPSACSSKLKARKLYDGAVDGLIGAKTLNALRAVNDLQDVIVSYIDRRLAFLKRLKCWKTFGRGWQRRVDSVLERSVDLLYTGVTPTATPVRPTAVSDCRTPHDVAGACDIGIGKTTEGQAAAGVGIGTAGAAVSEAAGQLAPLADYSEVLKWLFIGLLVVSIGITLWSTLRNAKTAEVA